MAGLVESIALPSESLCLGCLTGKYPVEVPEERHRFQKNLAEF
jgi:amidophosphoribosyltransferase